MLAAMSTAPARATLGAGAVAAAALLLAGCGVLEGTAERSTASPLPPPTREPIASATADLGAPTPSATPSAAPVPPTTLVAHAGQEYRVVEIDLSRFDLRIDWDSGSDGQTLAEVVTADPSVVVATNAGIFTPSFAPGGLLVSDGEVLRDLNLSDGAGNFHLMPNAVFGLRDDGTAFVVESSAYDGAGVTFATQSGPALLLGGEVHPAFNEGSANLAWRSGVGVSADGGTVYLALSVAPTNFWDFATMFRDELGLRDALYLDGQISDLWVAGDGEPSPFYGPFAGIITVRER